MIDPSKAKLFLANYRAGQLTANDLEFAVKLAVEYIEERDSGLPQPVLQRSEPIAPMPMPAPPERNWNLMFNADQKQVLYQAVESLYERSVSVQDRQLPTGFKAVRAVARTRNGVFAVVLDPDISQESYYGYVFLNTARGSIELQPVRWKLDTLDTEGAPLYRGDPHDLDLVNFKWL